MSENNRICLGYWLPEKKKKKMKFHRFEDLCRSRSVAAIEIDLHRSLLDQGPFDVILHKLSDDITIKADCGDVEAATQLQNFRAFTKQRPEVAIVDPLDRTMAIRDRLTMFQVLQHSSKTMTGDEVFVPSFAEIAHHDRESNLKLLKSSNVSFPIVCKPSDAGNPDTSHDMSLVFNPEGLKDVNPPFVAQSFINHDGVLHKIFVLGERTFLVERPSIKNLFPGDEQTEHFITKDVSKPNSASHLNEKTVNRESACFHPDTKVLENIASHLRLCLGIDLFGVDVIIEKSTGRCGLIDINPFPGYDGVPEVHEYLLQYLIGRARQGQENNNHGQAKHST